MTTIIIDTRYTEAKELLRKLRNARYATIIEGNKPNAESRRAIAEIEAGKGQKAKSATDLFNSI
jgi:hypothetical protein